MPVEPGRMLSHYRLVEMIGEGGMGVVWKALDAELNRHVAIKILPADLTSDPERRLRFKREAQTAAALSHPNIAVIHEVGEHEGTPFLVMELLKGRTLRERMGREPLPLKDWLRFARPIADALAHAHKNGIVHRDLKPSNVMITEDDQVKLLDFGLAKILDPDSSDPASCGEASTRLDTISRDLTREGKIIGTVAYMSPEQARGEPLDHRTDIFSLGVLLYEMATGDLPFTGRSDIESLHATITADPPAFPDMAGGLPAVVERMVRKAMEKEPERRYQRADDLASDLRDLTMDLDSGRASMRPRRPSRWWIGVAAVVAVAGLAAILRFGLPVPVGTSPAPTDPSSRPVAVMGFANVMDPEDSSHLGRALMGLVTTDLAESGGLHVVSTSKVLAALREAGVPASGGFDASLAQAAARTADAGVMLVGQVTQAGTRLILSAELVDVATGSTIGSLKRVADSDAELFSLAGSIAKDVRARLGVDASPSGSSSFDLARSLTTSADAYKQYAAGQIAFDEVRWPEAIRRFEGAIERDETFALAYYRLGWAHSWAEDHDASLGTLRRGIAYIDRLPGDWRMLYQAFLHWGEGDVARAYDLLEPLVARSVQNADVHYLFGEILTHADPYRDPARARAVLAEALEIDPTFLVVCQHLFETHVLADDMPGAEQVLEGDCDSPVLRMQAALAKGDRDTGLDLAATLTEELERPFYAYIMAGEWSRAFGVADAERGPKLPRAYAYRGLARAGWGDLRAAIADLQRSIDLRDAMLDNQGLRSARRLDLAIVLLAVGDLGRAVSVAREAVRLEPTMFAARFWLGRLQLEAGLQKEALETLRGLEDATPGVPSPKARFWVELLRAETELAGGRIEGASGRLDDLARLAPEYREPVIEGLTRARVREAEGDTAGAMEAWRVVLDPGAQLRTLSAHPAIPAVVVVGRALALRSLARLEDRAGGTDGARRHYREFLDMWGDADMPVAGVAEARARLAELEAR